MNGMRLIAVGLLALGLCAAAARAEKTKVDNAKLIVGTWVSDKGETTPAGSVPDADWPRERSSVPPTVATAAPAASDATTRKTRVRGLTRATIAASTRLYF